MVDEAGAVAVEEAGAVEEGVTGVVVHPPVSKVIARRMKIPPPVNALVLATQTLDPE
ncbi:MAG: hypothetical protein WBO34_04565 [Gammaproteobacteria bacterium]